MSKETPNPMQEIVDMLQNVVEAAEALDGSLSDEKDKRFCGKMALKIGRMKDKIVRRYD